MPGVPLSSIRWRPRRQLVAQCRPPRPLHSWLDHSGSLTARLIELSRGAFRVQVLTQGIARPSREEQRALGLERANLVMVREVILYGDQQPWVFARSLLPMTSLTGQLRHLRKQGNRPLGAFLFSQPQLVRGPIAVAAFSADDSYLASLKMPRSAPLWGRRSVFSLGGKPLLVSEVFLPALCDRLIAQP